MSSLRQRITDQVASRLDALEGIKGVWIWRPGPLAQDELPGIVLRDRRCESRKAATQVDEHRLTFEVDIYSTDVVQVRDLAAAVIRTIGSDVRWKEVTTSLAVTTEPVSDELMTEQEERFLVGCRITFVVLYRTKSFEPSEPVQ